MIYLAGNPIYYTVQTSEPSREVRLKLFVETAHYSGNFQEVIAFQRTSDSGSQITFEFQDILNSIVSLSDTYPLLNNSGIVSGAVRRFYLSTTQIDPVTGDPTNWVDSTMRTVLAGQVPVSLFPTFNIFEYLTQTKGFLTWQPNYKQVTHDQLEVLYFLVQTPGVANVKIRRIYYSTPDANGDVVLLSSVDEVVNLPVDSYGRVVSVPAKLSAYPNAGSLYLIVLNPNNNALSEPRYFYYTAKKPSETNRFFIFRNSLGAFDTLRTTGVQSGSLEGTDQLAERMLTKGYTHVKPQFFAWSQEAERTIKQATGVRSAEEMDYLQEWVFSPQRYEWIQGRLLPILLKKRTLPYSQDNRFRTGYTFEYEYAHAEEAYAAPVAWTFIPREPPSSNPDIILEEQGGGAN